MYIYFIHNFFYILHFTCCILSSRFIIFHIHISISLIYNEYCKKIHFNNNFLVKCMKKPSSHFVPSYVSNCATLRTTLYSRDIFLVPLARMAFLFLNEKWLSTFYIEEKFDTGDWKEALWSDWPPPSR